ncbi:uncharacterized protein M421DRAFT_200198 [Didymella exigua CBS 183.55]|uniref:Uncharacterized protein n=1 Tax=Didymella exigua CBS 183.55 TaxID=1150837 RepID=A0A6A5S103_9PLEO|nr:uncharacterized protein M421DRAFT_200198 [Didymella exigua CBS 183.55]KAF1933563.1 hypothetical protein M421DRAFT_200198 [Didymella exigua CBS 183.55]
MSILSGGRQNDASIQYTAVGHGNTYGDSDFSTHHQRHAHSDNVDRASIDIRHETAGDGPKTEGATYYVIEAGQAPSNKTSGHCHPPAIQGWPQGPRKLGGVSVLFLIGDILLLLLPVAFLGPFGTLQPKSSHPDKK